LEILHRFKQKFSVQFKENGKHCNQPVCLSIHKKSRYTLRTAPLIMNTF